MYLLILVPGRTFLLILTVCFIGCSVSLFLSLISRCVSLLLVAEVIEALLVVLRFYVPTLLRDTFPIAFLRFLLYSYGTFGALFFE